MMNFNRSMMGHFFYSLTNFILALFFLVFGIACILMAWFPGLRIELLRFLEEGSWLVFFAGVAFILIGAAILFNLFIHSRRKTYIVRSGKNAIEVDQTLIEETLDMYWKQLFPQYSIPSQVKIKNNQVYITADFPLIAEDDQSSFVKSIEESISSIFSRTLGYRNDFFLSASFQDLPSRY